jgi:hypothetical protein
MFIIQIVLNPISNGLSMIFLEKNMQYNIFTILLLMMA